MSARSQRCMVAGCGVALPCWQHICAEHWRLLPGHLKAAIVEANRARAPHLATKAAADAAAWIKEHGPAAEAARRCGERVE